MPLQSSSSEAEVFSPSSKAALLDASRKIDRLRNEITAELENQLTRATKNGRLDEALAIKDEIAQLASQLSYSLSTNAPWSRSSIWKPLGGKTATEFNSFSLQGPGTGPTENAVAVFSKPLRVGETLRGTLTVDNDWSGFALGATRGANEFYAFYTHFDKSAVWKHSGKERREVAVDIPVKIPVAEPVSFSLFRPDKRKIILTVGDSSYTFFDESEGGYWGITTYAGRKAEVTLE
jgi:hypothetical protein